MSFRGSFPRLKSATSVDIQPVEKNIEYKSGATYVGQVSDNKKCGCGRFVWPSGATYDGEFINNVRQGKGIAISEDGSRYEGEFTDDMRHGQGTQTWFNKESYVGDFFKDRRHGSGTYSWPEGSSFSGKFYMDRKEGYGRFSFPDGAAFEGLYRNDEREGPGVMTYPDGKQDVGIWRREALVKLCLEADTAFTMNDHKNFDYDPEDHVTYIQLTDDNDSMEVFKDLLNLPDCFDYAQFSKSGLNSPTIFNDALRSDSLAVNKKSFDEAFFKTKQLALEDTDKDRDESSKLKVLNTTPTIIEMQKHVYKHRHQEASVSYDVQKILQGDRTEFADCGPKEAASLDLMHAAWQGDTETVQRLVESQEAHPDVSDRNGHTPLIAASVTWHQNIINYLLDSGANVNQVNDEGISSLAACHVFFYPMDSFKYNIAEQPLVFKSTIANLTSVSKRKVNNSSSVKFADQIDSKSDKNSKSVDSGFRTEELTPVETVEKTPEKSSDEKTQDSELDESVNGSLTNESQTNVSLMDENQNAHTDDLEKVSMEGSETEAFDKNDREKEVNVEKEDVEDEITNIDESEQTEMDHTTDKDSLLLSDEDITEANDEQELQEKMEFQSNASLVNYEIEVPDNLINRCATQLSFNKFVTRMVRSSANFSDVDEARHRALQMADHMLMESTIRLLLQRGADPNSSSVPMPCLFFAIKAADVEAVRILLLKGASTNAVLPFDKGGLAALHIAVGIPGEEGVLITELLLNALAHPDVQAAEDESFLNRTLEDEWMKDTIDELTKSRLGGRTPLHIASARDDCHKFACQVVHLLLDHHANPNLLCNGHSPLSLAITSGNDLAIDELLAYGADPSLPLSHGIGSALCVASSTEYEHRRTPSGRIQLIDKLMKSGANILAPIAIGSKRITGSAIDFAYYMFNMDRRIAHMPYHALTPAERDTYNARRKLLAHLGDLLRVKAVEREHERLLEDEREGRRTANPSTDFTYTGAGADPPGIIKTKGTKQVPGLDSHVSFRQTEGSEEFQKSKGVQIVTDTDATKLWSSQSKRKNKSPARKPLFKYCYECGRSVGVRLAACSRCKEVYYCSKACKLKAWNARHKEECVRVGMARDPLHKHKAFLKDREAKSRSPSPGQRGRVDSPTPATVPDGETTTVKNLTSDVNKLRIKVPVKGRSASAENLQGKRGTKGGTQGPGATRGQGSGATRGQGSGATRGGTQGSGAMKGGTQGGKGQSYSASKLKSMKAAMKGGGKNQENIMAGTNTNYYPTNENYSFE